MVGEMHVQRSRPLVVRNYLQHVFDKWRGAIELIMQHILPTIETSTET